MEFKLIEVSYTKNRRGLPVFTYRHRASGQEYEFHDQQPTQAELEAAYRDSMGPDAQMLTAALRNTYCVPGNSIN